MIGLWGSEMSYGCKHPASRGQCDLIWRNFCKFINYIVFGNFWTYMGKLLKNLCADDKDRGSDWAKMNNLKWRFKIFGLTHWELVIENYGRTCRSYPLLLISHTEKKKGSDVAMLYICKKTPSCPIPPRPRR